MSNKKKLIEDGKNIEMDNIIVLNDKSLAEKIEVKQEAVAEQPVSVEPVAASEPVQSVEEAVVAPSIEPTLITPDINLTAPVVPAVDENKPAETNGSEDFGVSSINDDAIKNAQNSDDVFGDLSKLLAGDSEDNSAFSFGNVDSNETSADYGSSEYGSSFSYDNDEENEKPTNYEFSYEPVSYNESKDVVFKSPEDVDKASNAYITAVHDEFIKNMADPIKRTISVLDGFVKWGNAVTVHGLNRELFNEYDRLLQMYNGLDVSSYGDAEPVVDKEQEAEQDENTNGFSWAA